MIKLKEKLENINLYFFGFLFFPSIPIVYSIIYGGIKGDYFEILFSNYSYENGFSGFIFMIIKSFLPFCIFYILAIICLILYIKKIRKYYKKTEEQPNIKKTIIISVIIYLLILTSITLGFKYKHDYVDIPYDAAIKVNTYLNKKYKNNSYKIFKVIENKKLESCGGLFNSCSPVDNSSYIVFLAKDKNNNSLKVKYINYSSNDIKIKDENDDNFYDENDIEE